MKKYNTEHIEKYLLGYLTLAEKETFEADMQRDASLKEEVELQENINKRSRRAALALLVTDAHSRYTNSSSNGLWKNGRNYLLGGLLLVGMISGIVYFNQQNSTEEKSTVIQQKSEQPVEAISIADEKPPKQQKLLSIPFNEYTFLAEKGAVINDPTSGAKITIPKNALVTCDGQQVTGRVSLKYREFRNQADIAISHIPMTYQDQNFNSAGMFEMRAFQNGKELCIASGENASIDFVMTKNEEGIGFYALDDSTEKWAFINNIPIKQALEKEIVMPTEGVKVVEENPAESDILIPQIKAEPMPSFVTDTIPRGYELKNKNNVLDQFKRATASMQLDWEANNPGLSSAGSGGSSSRGQTNSKTERPPFFKRIWQSLFGKNKQNTEANTVEEETANNNFSDYEKRLRDSLTFYGKESIRNMAELMMKLDEFHSSDEEKDQLMTNNKTFNQRMRQYVDTLNNAEDPEAYVRELIDRALNKKEVVNRELTTEEQQKAREKIMKQWQARQDSINALWDTKAAIQDSINNKWKKLTGSNFIARNSYKPDAGHTFPQLVRELKIPRFGTYNCDQVYKLRPSLTVLADYLNQAGDKISDPWVLSVIDLKVNGAFSFDPKRFSFNPRSKTTLVLFTHSGKLYIIQNDKIKNMTFSRNRKQTFQMTDITDKVSTSADLQKILQQKPST